MGGTAFADPARRRWRSGSLNGGFISTRSQLACGVTARGEVRRRCRADIERHRIDAVGEAVARRVLRGECASADRPRPGPPARPTRAATARPAAPTPAPRSTALRLAAPASPRRAGSRHGRSGGRGAAAAGAAPRRRRACGIVGRTIALREVNRHRGAVRGRGPASSRSRRADRIWSSATRMRRGRMPSDPSSTLMFWSRTM